MLEREKKRRKVIRISKEEQELREKGRDEKGKEGERYYTGKQSRTKDKRVRING